MSEWYDNQSAEVVLRKPLDTGNQRKCLDRCVKRLKAQELQLILRIHGDESDPGNPASRLGASAIQMKKIRSRLQTCIKRCLKKIEDDAQ